MPTHGGDGGPAFPVPVAAIGNSIDKDAGHYLIQNGLGGMSLRDWFAGQALAGAMVDDGNVVEDHGKMAAYCYRQADAMLKAREGTR